MSVAAPPIVAPRDVATKGSARGRSIAAIVIPPAIVFVLFIGIWILASKVLIVPEKRFLLPPPWDVVDKGFFDSFNRTEILKGLWLTTKAALLGFGIAVVIGMAIAILMSQARWIERSLYPYAVVLQTVPILALVPLIGFTLGFNFPSRVFVVVLIAIFPIITNTLFGLLSVDKAHHDLFTLSRASRFTRLWKLQLPGAMPAIFTGFRISAGLSVIGAVVGDFFFQQGAPGIGVLINLYANQLESERLYAAVIASSLLGIAVFVLVGFVNQRVVGRWHDSASPTR